MNKIICDVCGTTYTDTADRCPICGYGNNNSVSAGNASLTDADEGKGGKFSSVPEKKHKSIFDFDEENGYEPEEIEEYAYDQREQYSQQKQGTTVTPASMAIVIILVVIITLLLVGIGFLLFRYYIPNRAQQQALTTEPATQVTTVQTTQPEETTEPTIPCTSLVLTSGVTKLTKEGQYWLLHVMVSPEDTTDQLVYTSEDESVVTVNEHGRLTAVGEGQTNVFIRCGEKEIKCRVEVGFEEETKPVETEATAPNAVEHEELPEEAAEAAGVETKATEETKEPEATETKGESEPTEATESPKDSGEIILKLKDKDRSSGVRGVTFTLELDCDLEPEDVTWLTLDSDVALVHNGVVTTIGPGKTKIIAQYEGQTAECIIRCTFS